MLNYKITPIGLYKEIQRQDGQIAEMSERLEKLEKLVTLEKPKVVKKQSRK